MAQPRAGVSHRWWAPAALDGDVDRLIEPFRPHALEALARALELQPELARHAERARVVGTDHGLQPVQLQRAKGPRNGHAARLGGEPAALRRVVDRVAQIPPLAIVSLDHVDVEMPVVPARLAIEDREDVTLVVTPQLAVPLAQPAEPGAGRLVRIVRTAVV